MGLGLPRQRRGGGTGPLSQAGPLQGDAAHGRRRALCGDVLRSGRRHRCRDRRAEVGLRHGGLAAQPAHEPRLQPPRRGLLDGRRAGADPHADEPGVPVGHRRPHRRAGRRLRRGRQGRPDGGARTTGAAARLLGHLRAHDRRRHGDRRFLDLRRADAQGDAARTRPRVRRAHGRAEVDLPHDSPGRRAGRRDLGETTPGPTAATRTSGR